MEEVFESITLDHVNALLDGLIKGDKNEVDALRATLLRGIRGASWGRGESGDTSRGCVDFQTKPTEV